MSYVGPERRVDPTGQNQGRRESDFVRCSGCGKTICRGEVRQGRIEIKCATCNRMNYLVGPLAAD